MTYPPSGAALREPEPDQSSAPPAVPAQRRGVASLAVERLRSAATTEPGRLQIIGAALALGGGESARSWLLAGTFADAIDLAATLKFRDDLPRPGVVGVGLLAGGSAALGARLLTELD